MEGDRLKPILKWAGGKEKELKYILPNMPSSFANYYEPFVGGGSVFMAVEAAHAYINDLSEELINLYRYLQASDKKFFSYAYAIDNAWEKAYLFFKFHPQLIDFYLDYKSEKLSKHQLEICIKDFVKDCTSSISDIISDITNANTDVFNKELQKNIYRKFIRIHELELQKHELPFADIEDNVETTIKGSLYMCLRHLYNDHNSMQVNPCLASAIFLFIRNYAYSGMFRYNAKGEFNVPYGGIGYNKKQMAKKLDYYQSSRFLKHISNATIENIDFEDFIRSKDLTADDFIFLDPPYDSEFSTYAQNEFTKKDQKRLANFFINECPAKWMLVIKYTDYIYSLYKNIQGIRIRSFEKEYVVSFMNRNDRKTTHLMITNY